MSSRSSRLCLALAFSGTAQLLLMTALVVLPQWRAQQSANDGFVTFFVGKGGSVRLWNRPVDAAVIPGLLRRAEQLNPATRVRMVLAPGVAWGQVQDLVFLLETTRLDVELQLPPAARS